jgi:hypothetical protein
LLDACDPLIAAVQYGDDTFVFLKAPDHGIADKTRASNDQDILQHVFLVVAVRLISG